MAHTDACKIQVTEFVRKLTDTGMSVNAACKEVQRESDGIPAETIRRWWQEIKARTAEELVRNDQPPPTPENQSEIPDNQVPEAKHGGKREGAGAPQKYEKPTPPWSCAMQMAGLAIDQLERIPTDDPKRQDAFQKVMLWIKENR